MRRPRWCACGEYTRDGDATGTGRCVMGTGARGANGVSVGRRDALSTGQNSYATAGGGRPGHGEAVGGVVERRILSSSLVGATDLV